MIVNTKYGKIQGKNEYSCVVFKGIPYAKAPVGERRFNRPEPVDKWEGIFDATKWGNKCIQREQEKGSFYQKEFYDNQEFSADSGDDCLNLNIYLPKDIEQKIEKGMKLPVGIYVHGGAFMGGAGSNLPFVPTKLVEEDVLIVTINYRLGVFGFLAHPLLMDISGQCSCGNYGLWDQLAAFKWVKENIESFGGDSENITLFGQSAGAMSLQIHALSDEAEGLYHKMILQSGGGYRNPLSSFKTGAEGKEYGEWLFDIICEKKGLPRDDEKAIAEYLLNGDSKEILEMSLEVVGRSFREGKGFAFVPVIDDVLLEKDGNELMAEGKFRKTPYILGANKNDITMENAKDFSALANPMEKANVDYAALANGVCADSYVYYFKHELPGDGAGAFHSAELWYVFGSLDYSWRKEYFKAQDYELSEKIVKYWTNFMKTGDPNFQGQQAWEKCTVDNPFVMEFD
ncbi:MAG: carboxylesterase family protein [Butyrivibrio sp.]|nr:carboxylesterase family protein [Butyrivibrio sp.]